MTETTPKRMTTYMKKSLKEIFDINEIHSTGFKSKSFEINGDNLKDYLLIANLNVPKDFENSLSLKGNETISTQILIRSSYDKNGNTIIDFDFHIKKFDPTKIDIFDNSKKEDNIYEKSLTGKPKDMNIFIEVIKKEFINIEKEVSNIFKVKSNCIDKNSDLKI